MIKKRQIGKLDLYVTEIGLGTAPLGGWPIAVDEQKALEPLETAWNNGIRYFDTLTILLNIGQTGDREAISVSVFCIGLCVPPCCHLSR